MMENEIYLHMLSILAESLSVSMSVSMYRFRYPFFSVFLLKKMLTVQSDHSSERERERS